MYVQRFEDLGRILYQTALVHYLNYTKKNNIMRSLKLIKLLSFLFVLSLMVVSCSKEATSSEEEIPGEFTPIETTSNDLLRRSTTSASQEGLDLDCVTVLYSFEVVDIEGTTYTIGTEEDFIALFEDSAVVVIVDFVYPLTVADEDGVQSDVADAQELAELFANCLPNGWEDGAFPAYLINAENSCLSLQYPLTVTDLEGEVQVFEDEDDFVAALSSEVLFFSFPMSLTNLDGETVIAGNIDELLTALFDCNVFVVDSTLWIDGGFEFIGCYQLTFPFDLELADGTVVTVVDHMQYCDLLISGSVAGFAFPLNLIDEDGEAVVVNSQEELNEIIDACYDFGGGTGGGNVTGDLGLLLYVALNIDSTGTVACYTINWPIDATQIDAVDGEEIGTVTITSLDEALSLPGMNSGEFVYNVIYPVTVTNTDGTVVTINGIEDIFQALEDCQ